MDTTHVARDWFKTWTQQMEAFGVHPSLHRAPDYWFLWDQNEYSLARHADLVTCCEMALAKLQAEATLKAEVQALCVSVARRKGWENPDGAIYWAEAAGGWSSASGRKIGMSLAEAKVWLESQLEGTS